MSRLRYIGYTFETQYYDGFQPETARFYAEHILEKAEELVEGIVGTAVGKVFPNLKWEETKPAVK